MKNNNFLKTSYDQFSQFSRTDKKFILKIPNLSLKKQNKVEEKSNDSFINIIGKQVKKSYSSKNIKSYRMMNPRHLETTLRQTTNTTMELPTALFSPRKFSLSRLKKQKYRRQTIGNEMDNKQYCKILIQVQKQNVMQYKVKLTTSSQLIQKLKTKLSNNIIGFKTKHSNIKLDLLLSLQNINISYLNGTSLRLVPLYQPQVQNKKVGINDFQIINCIGTGGFSQVFLVRFKKDGLFYAMKLIDKYFIINNNKTQIVNNQRNVMQILNSHFVVKMKYAFQTSNYLAFVLHYCPGGEIFSIIKKHRRFTQDMARFYMIEILLALQHIHSQGIIYRDFKPQNILLDINGHIKIADFGLAKPNYFSCKDRAFSFCGSPQYMPPQMILKQGHSLGVDFYCLGAVLYQFVTGLPPFYSKQTKQIYQSTVNQQIKFPSKFNLSNQLKDLLRKLLCKEEKYRLGAMFGTKEVLSHTWFGKFSKEAYLKRQVKPPVSFQTVNQLNFDFQYLGAKQQEFLLRAKQQQQKSLTKFKSQLKGFYYEYDAAFSQLKYKDLILKKDNQLKHFKRQNSQRTLMQYQTARGIFSIPRSSNASTKNLIQRLQTNESERQGFIY